MNRKFTRTTISSLTVFALSFFAYACGKEVRRTGDTLAQLEPPTVCVPSDPSNPGGSQNGLAGSIKYLSDDQARASTVDELLTNGHDAGVTLILNSVSVPTTRFTSGFIDPATGTPLKKSSGDVLVEWFGFDVHSDLTLTTNEPDGYYQVALLADDGAILELSAVGSTPSSVLVANDGVHSTTMGCSSKAILMERAKPRPIHIKYFQGPREHIALTMLWRKVATETDALDSTCGTSGNDTFWDSSTTPSTPTQTYNDLIARGWKVPASANFTLPAEIPSNPCNGQ